MLLHYLAKLERWKFYFLRKCFMLICQQTHKSHRNYHLITVILLFIHKAIGFVHQTKTKKGNKAFSYLFWHTLSDHHICHAWCKAAWVMLRMEVFPIKHELHLTEVFHHLNKMLIATKHNPVRVRDEHV